MRQPCFSQDDYYIYCLCAVFFFDCELLILLTSGSSFQLWINRTLLTSGSPFQFWINPILLTSGSPFALWISLMLLTSGSLFGFWLSSIFLTSGSPFGLLFSLIFVPRNLPICAILRLHSAFLGSYNCGAISRSRNGKIMS